MLWDSIWSNLLTNVGVVFLVFLRHTPDVSLRGR